MVTVCALHGIMAATHRMVWYDSLLDLSAVYDVHAEAPIDEHGGGAKVMTYRFVPPLPLVVYDTKRHATGLCYYDTARLSRTHGILA
jgi:hypothetical protein